MSRILSAIGLGRTGGRASDSKPPSSSDRSSERSAARSSSETPKAPHRTDTSPLDVSSQRTLLEAVEKQRLQQWLVGLASLEHWMGALSKHRSSLPPSANRALDEATLLLGALTRSLKTPISADAEELSWSPTSEAQVACDLLHESFGQKGIALGFLPVSGSVDVRGAQRSASLALTHLCLALATARPGRISVFASSTLLDATLAQVKWSVRASFPAECSLPQALVASVRSGAEDAAGLLPLENACELTFSDGPQHLEAELSFLVLAASSQWHHSAAAPSTRHPLAPEVEDRSPAPSPRSDATSATQSSVRRSLFPDARVLVIEDNAASAMFVQAVLKRAGLDVVTVDQGELGLAQLLIGGFDAVILDLGLPDMVGFEVLSRWREVEKQQALPTLPILAYTARSFQDHDLPPGLSFTKAIQKSAHPQALLTALDDCLAASRLNQRPPN